MKMFVYAGSYTPDDEARGIHVCRLDPATGALEHVSSAGGARNPSFLALDPANRFLYAVCETSDETGAGAIAAFSIDRDSGAPTFLNQASSVGGGPCHLTVDATGAFVLAANYGSGSVCMLPIRDDGSLGEATDFVQHEGSSVNPQRQTSPHAHSINIDPGNRYAFSPDLGLDKILIYELDLKEGKLTPNSHQPFAQVAPGAGPRHFAFHPNRKFAYVINEIGNTFTAFAYDESKGTLDEIHSVSTLPEGYSETTHTADLHVSPSGRFLYGSNRGHDSIAICAIDEDTGELSQVGVEPTQGKNPRNFALDPSGIFLFAANQDTDSVVTFRVDADSGELAATGDVVELPKPVCLKFASA
jgi:6-phosphogluconolactonase